MTSPEDPRPEDPQAPGAEGEQPSPEPERETEQPDAQSAEPAEAEEKVEEPREPLRPVDVYAILRVSVAQLTSVAWQMMGLQADPFTNQVRKDLDQARIAIDAAAGLVEQLRPHLQGQEARDYQSLLTDLRLNFVKQSGESGAGQ